MNLSSKVYELCQLIPAGKISSYKILANKLKTHPRVIAQILKHNLKPIKIPCHRIISSNGYISGYFGKHVKQKIKLLKKEGIKIKDNKVLNFKKILYKF